MFLPLVGEPYKQFKVLFDCLLISHLLIQNVRFIYPLIAKTRTITDTGSNKKNGINRQLIQMHKFTLILISNNVLKIKDNEPHMPKIYLAMC